MVEVEDVRADGSEAVGDVAECGLRARGERVGEGEEPHLGEGHADLGVGVGLAGHLGRGVNTDKKARVAITVTITITITITISVARCELAGVRALQGGHEDGDLDTGGPKSTRACVGRE